MKRNIFVVGLDELNLELLQAVHGAAGYTFHSLLDVAEVTTPRTYPVEALLEKARSQLRDFPGRVDAIVGYWDFPTTALVQILRAERGLPAPGLEALLRCEHKYWSRLLQREVIPEHTPGFAVFDPFTSDPRAAIDLDYPFWVKPVKAHSSFLGFRIEDGADFDHAIEQTREGIHRFAEPFNYVLDRAQLPPEIATIDGYHCMAEAITGGRQCTLEGYVFEGEPVVYGAVDSHRASNGSSFTRYQYPSSLPESVLQHMADASARLMVRTGLNNAPFNIEWFYDEAAGRAWILEVNPRISKSHAPLFEMVDGAAHHEVMVDLALGQRPAFPRHEGLYPCAAKFMLREWCDQVAIRTPTAAEIAAVERSVPGTRIQLAVHDGMRLSRLRNQDSYSYEVAVAFVGAPSEAGLLEKYEQCLARLPFEYAGLDNEKQPAEVR